MSMGMRNQLMGPEEFALVADDEDRSYLYRSLPDEPIGGRRIGIIISEPQKQAKRRWLRRPPYAMSCTVPGVSCFPPTWSRSGKTCLRWLARPAWTCFLAAGKLDRGSCPL
jgi:hypothetical protein